ELKFYGLDARATRLHADLRGGKSLEIRIGNPDPTQEGYYAFLLDKDQLVVVPASFAELVFKSVDDWRDRALVHFTQEKVERIRIRDHSGEMVLAKRNKHWII